jgi:hypothetical protein
MNINFAKGFICILYPPPPLHKNKIWKKRKGRSSNKCKNGSFKKMCFCFLILHMYLSLSLSLFFAGTEIFIIPREELSPILLSLYVSPSSLLYLFRENADWMWKAIRVDFENLLNVHLHHCHLSLWSRLILFSWNSIFNEKLKLKEKERLLLKLKTFYLIN